jgi:arsenate reductase
MHPKLESYIENIVHNFNSISQQRKQELEEISLYISEQRANNEVCNLLFICTHNSRRSHFCQIWSATAASYYGLDNVHTFSGGTETTAFNYRAAAAIERAGFEVYKPEGDNPRYRLNFSPETYSIECFSKKFGDEPNPKENFCAVMTCNDADKNCPFVPGASLRISLPYKDPKSSDGSYLEKETYDERSFQIATEMFYAFSQVKK